jgi:copper(I)-binding protein
MLFKRILSLAVALVFSLSAFAFAQEATAKAPKLTIVDPLKDFGTVPKGEKLVHAFTIRNTGDADLQILSAQPACGCTVAEFDKVIKPGQTGKVMAEVETVNFAGPISKGVTLQTNDPNTPTAQVTINAVVKPYVEAYPAGFVRYNVLQGDAQTQTVTLYSEEEEPFVIKSIEVPGPHVKATYTKISKDEERAKAGRTGQNQYRIDITLGGPDAKIGPLAEKIRIVTNSKRQPEYLVSLTGIVRPAYSVVPTVLNFSEVTPDEVAATRTIMVQSNDRNLPGEFKVTRVESTNPSLFLAEAKPTDTPGRYEVTVKVAKQAKAGLIDGNVKIYTSDKTTPVFTLPVRGTIRG